MSTVALYQDIVLDHYRHPRGHGAVAGCTHAADGVNPLCGDSLRIELRCEDGRVVAFGFTGEACAITTATASMLAELSPGLDGERIAGLMQRFERLLEGADDDAELGPLNAMRELRRHPSRRKCALLPWATLRAALQGSNRASTEEGTA